MMNWLYRAWIFSRVKVIAKGQLRAIEEVQNTFPILEGSDLYYQALKTQPGYTWEKAMQLIERAREIKNIKYETDPLRFRDVVYALMLDEVSTDLDTIETPTEERHILIKDNRLNAQNFTSYYEIIATIIPSEI